MAAHSAVSNLSVLATDIRFCDRDLKAFRRAKSDWFVSEQDLQQSVECHLSGAVLRLEKSLCEVTHTQAHCRRRILCRVRVLTRVAAPNEILAKP